MPSPHSHPNAQAAIQQAMGHAGSAQAEAALRKVLGKFDTTAPSALVTLDDDLLAVGDTAVVTIRFSEAVEGFGLEDLSASFGTLSNLAQSTLDPLLWTVLLTPTAGLQASGGTVTLAPGYTDIAGNGGEPAASAPYAVDTLAPTAVIVAARESLRVGESTILTISFSEDVGGSFGIDDLVASGGALSELAGEGLQRTVKFTATQPSGLSTHASIGFAPGSFSDAAGNASQGEGSVEIATAFNKVLFVGNSATFARADPVMGYNTWDAETNPGGVHDLTSPDRGGTFTNYTGVNLYEPHDWGGVAGLVDAFADQVGLGYDISLSTRNAATLRGHYLNSSQGGWDMRGNIASDAWDLVVLQDQTDEPLPGGFGSITFAAGSSTASLVIRPTQDAVREYDETLGLTLSSSSGYRVGTSSTVTAGILNDDPTASASNPALPTVTLTATPGSVAEDGTANLVYTFTRNAPAATDLTVTFTVFRDGSTAPSVSNNFTAATQDLEMYNATTGALITSPGSGTPYRFTSGAGFPTAGMTGPNTTTGSVSFTSNTGTIVIKAGQTSASLTLDPHADTNLEGDESIKITLTHPTSGQDYNVGTLGAVTATIVNDDFAPGTDTSLPNVTLALSSATTAYENAGQDLVFTFTRSGSTAQPLTVYFDETGSATWFQGTPSASDFSVLTTGAAGYSLVTTSGNNADIATFEKFATLIENYIHDGAADTTTQPGTTIAANPNANPEADVYLYATWARPDMIAGARDMLTDKTLVTSGPEAGAFTGGTISDSGIQATAYYLRLEDMSEDLTEAYTHLAEVNPDFAGVAAVSSAFMNAVTQGIAIRDPYTETPGDGQVNLWFEDNLHASKYGSYLAGLMLFQTLSGLDAQVLGAGDRAAADLGIDAATAVALQRVASATAGFDSSLHWTAPGQVADLGGSGASATLATAGAYSFVDDVYSAHNVTVIPTSGNLGSLSAAVRSDGHAGQVNWLYTVDNAAVDPLLGAGQQRVDEFTLLLDDGHGHVSVEVIGVQLLGIG